MIARTSTRVAGALIAVVAFTTQSPAQVLYDFADDPAAYSVGFCRAQWASSIQKMIVAYGNTDTVGGDNSVRAYDPLTNAWEYLWPNDYANGGPQQRDDQKSLYVAGLDEFWVWGGSHLETLPGALRSGRFNIATRTWLATSTTDAGSFVGVVRDFTDTFTNSAGAWSEVLDVGLVFGGSQQGNASDRYWIIEPNPEGPEPYRMFELFGGVRPPPRAQAQNLLAAAGQDFYLLGGLTAIVNNQWIFINDFWRFDGAARTWSELPSPPSASYASTLTYDSEHHALIAWVYDRIYAFPIAVGQWIDITPPNMPCNFNHVAAYSPTAGLHLFLGGNRCNGASSYMSVALRVTAPWQDGTAPDTHVTSAPPARTSSTSARFEFSSTETGSTFECNLDDAGFVACGSPQDYAGLTDGGHMFQVRAVSTAGIVDGSPAGHTWMIDTVAPNTTITSVPPATSSSAAGTFEFTSTETDSTFSCALDGGMFALCTTPTTYNGLGNGTHAFEVVAIDLAGNVDPTPASYSWTVKVDVTVPVVTSIARSGTSPTNAATVSWAVTFSENVSGVDATDFALAMSGLSGASISRVTGSGAIYTVTASTGSGSGTLGVNLVDNDSISDGTHALGGTGAENGGFSGPAYTVDRTPPDTVITSAPTGSGKRNAQFKFASSEAGSSFQCRLDGDVFAGCSSPANYSKLVAGDHMFEVRAIDAAGNADPTPASFRWIVK